MSEDSGTSCIRYHVTTVTQSLEKMKLWVTRAGEAYHVARCRFTKPPHSSTAMQYRACGECCAGAARAALSSTVVSNSPGSMAPVQG